jgi:hypothetical protein
MARTKKDSARTKGEKTTDPGKGEMVMNGA